MSGQTSEALLSLFDSARLRPRYWLNFGLLSLITVLEFFDFAIVAFLLAVLGPQWHPTYGQSAVILYSGGLGAICGAVIWGSMADAWGCKFQLVLGTFICGIGAGAIGLVPQGSWIVLAALRFVVGFGLTAAVTPCLTLVVEITPTRYRTSVTSFYVVFATAGALLASATSAALLALLGWPCRGAGRIARHRAHRQRRSGTPQPVDVRAHSRLGVRHHRQGHRQSRGEFLDRAFLGKEGDPRSVGYLLVPFTEIEIIDDWHVLGLAGTGSRSLRLRDVFVPAHRCVLLDDLLAGAPPGALVHPDYKLLRTPRGLLVNYSLPPVSIALGRRALSIAIAGLRGRISRGVTRMAASEFVQVAVGEAAAAIDAATLTMWNGRQAAEALVAEGRPIAPDVVLRARRDMTHAQHQVQWAIERLVEVCGARSVYDADPLASIRRDVLTLLTHTVASRQAAMGAWGRWALGVGSVG